MIRTRKLVGNLPEGVVVPRDDPLPFGLQAATAGGARGRFGRVICVDGDSRSPSHPGGTVHSPVTRQPRLAGVPKSVEHSQDLRAGSRAAQGFGVGAGGFRVVGLRSIRVAGIRFVSSGAMGAAMQCELKDLLENRLQFLPRSEELQEDLPQEGEIEPCVSRRVGVRFWGLFLSQVHEAGDVARDSVSAVAVLHPEDVVQSQGPCGGYPTPR